MKKTLTLLALVACTFVACNKNDDGDNNNGCEDGYICFTMDGTELIKPGSGYFFADTFSFIKYEEGQIQLSIDIMGNSATTYTVGDQQTPGKARIYWFDENNVMYMSRSGSLEVTEYTSGKVVTGTFSGILEKRVNDVYQGETKTVTNGTFKKIQLN